MTKIIRVLVLVLFLLTSSLILTACRKESKNKDAIIGTWCYNDEEHSSKFVFDENSTGSYTLIVGEESDNKNFDYKKDEEKIYIIFNNDTDPFEYEYSFDKDKLLLKNSLGDTLLLTKNCSQ